MEKKDVMFTKKGKVISKKPHSGAMKLSERGRKSRLQESLESDNFLLRLKRIDPNGLDNVIKELYTIATNRNEHVVARIRSCELILAYGLGKPPDTSHNVSDVQITFVRAEAIKQQIKEIGE
jgi:hypothetical protein